MLGFVKNKIFLDRDSLAEKLRSARQAKKLKLEEVAEKIGINIKYLNALEKGNLEKLPAGFYTKNIIREYAIFLGLDPKELLDILNEEINISEEKKEEVFSRKIISRHYFLAIPKIIRNILIIFVIAIIFLYLGFYLKKIFSAPFLEITSPTENQIIIQNSAEIIGRIEIGANLTINGEEVLSDSKGAFSKTINLKTGVNVITIEAEKKLGRKTTITRQILAKEEKLNY